MSCLAGAVPAKPANLVERRLWPLSARLAALGLARIEGAMVM